MNKKCLISIILYKQEISELEHLSLLRIIDFCYKNNMPKNLMFIMPISFDFDLFFDTYIFNYTNINNIEYFTYNWKQYDDDCFSSVNACNNRIYLNKNHYGAFINSYDYILQYQLDGYIFDNQLDYFLDKNYDYIGGYYLPMYCDRLAYKNFDNINDKHLLMNGGVSLKKISFCIDCIENNFQNINGCDFDNIHSYMNEDAFFSMFYTTEVTALESIKFSLNWAAAESHYAINNFKYPFCCHGINKSNFLLKLVEKYNKENNLDYSQYM